MTVSTMKTEAQVYREAADYVRRGWTRGTFFRSFTGLPLTLADATDRKGDLRCCLAGSVHLASRGAGLSDAILFGMLTQHLDGETPSVWNDDPHRKKSEVVKLLIDCAEAAEEDERRGEEIL